MKYVRKFNESINRKDVNETIDEVLDSLSKKGKLSDSEKKFMVEASNGTIQGITMPEDSDGVSFQSFASNPHNIGVMWIGKDGVWEQLKSIEDEESERNDIDEEDDWEKKRYSRADYDYKKLTPDGKKNLDLLINKIIQYQKETSYLYGEIKKENKNFEFNWRAEDGPLFSIGNRYGKIEYSDQTDEMFMTIGNKKYEI